MKKKTGASAARDDQSTSSLGSIFIPLGGRRPMVTRDDGPDQGYELSTQQGLLYPDLFLYLRTSTELELQFAGARSVMQCRQPPGLFQGDIFGRWQLHEQRVLSRVEPT
jgi:hypothetical protein